MGFSLEATLSVGIALGLAVVGLAVGIQSLASHAVTPTNQNSLAFSHLCKAAPSEQKVSGEQRSEASGHDAPQKMLFSPAPYTRAGASVLVAAAFKDGEGDS